MPIAVPEPQTMVSAEQFGIPITNEVNRLTPLVDGRTPTVWTNCVLQNSWANYAGYAPAQYRKIGDSVILRGAVAGGAIGSVITTLPVGFRAPATLQFIVASYSTFALVMVDNTGQIISLSPGDNRFYSLAAIGYSTIA